MTTDEPIHPGATLLIVEDDVLSAMALRDELDEAGYHVLDLTDRPEEALAAVAACKPRLALVNIQLHGLNDGIGLASDLQALGVPVLFISGQVSRARSAQSVAIGSLPKPYDPADMVRAVRFLLACAEGDYSLPRPILLEVFDGVPDAAAPNKAQSIT
jgi:DNA-binding response OmpR family regulator